MTNEDFFKRMRGSITKGDKADLLPTGFEVIDLGVDVLSHVQFCGEGKRAQAALYFALFLAYNHNADPKGVIETLKEAGIRERMKVLVGGAPVSQE